MTGMKTVVEGLVEDIIDSTRTDSRISKKNFGLRIRTTGGESQEIVEYLAAEVAAQLAKGKVSKEICFEGASTGRAKTKPDNMYIFSA
jgi:hypothetical protein